MYAYPTYTFTCGVCGTKATGLGLFEDLITFQREHAKTHGKGA